MKNASKKKEREREREREREVVSLGLAGIEAFHMVIPLMNILKEGIAKKGIEAKNFQLQLPYSHRLYSRLQSSPIIFNSPRNGVAPMRGIFLFAESPESPSEEIRQSRF